MKLLEEETINQRSPYKVTLLNGFSARFYTASGLEYEVSFIKDEMIESSDFCAYQILIECKNSIHSSNDLKMGATIAAILESYFKAHPNNILTYVCDIKGSQQEARNRLFNRWFHKYAKGEYVKYDWTLQTEEERFFASMVGWVGNPDLEDIRHAYDELAYSLSK